MTLSLETNARSLRRGFTLVEMLVVIGVIILLLGILLPAINIAYNHAMRNRMAMDIQTISAALEAYKNDQRDYPTLDYSDTTAGTGVMAAAYPGSVLLCRALIAPGPSAKDGHNGPGFTIIPNGQVYGPYIEPSRFKLVTDPGLSTTASTDPTLSFLADRYGHPILYFKAFLGADPTATSGYVAYWTGSGPRPMYNVRDDCGSSTNPALAWTQDGGNANPNALKRMELQLGDLDCNGQINGSETPIKLPYLLWSAGPDEAFGLDLTGSPTPSNAVLASKAPNVDDATNFKQ